MDSFISPSVAIVLLNWNNYNDTAECLYSLQNLDYSNYHIYVADNGSTDGSAERLAEEFPWCEVIFNNENLGFAAGNNRAIDQALEQGFDYILLLNNDTIVKPDFLKPLVKTGERYDDVVIVGGVIRDEAENVWSAGGSFKSWTLRLEHETSPSTSEYETRFVSGAMMLIDAAFLKGVGGLNESYFFGMEDEEIAWLARQQENRLMINPKSQIQHKVGQSSSEHSPFRYYHDARNRLAFATKNLPIQRRLFFYLFFTVTRMLRFVEWTFKGKVELIYATIVGVVDWLWNKPFRRVDQFGGI
ncbi:glycosyltransferase family 2 protein [Haladaptatus sp. DYSN1]|uniref:glycosyltransferase family 2 protein n=1 Tax=unclassified Haladaptatus TaxID=2622732 RepID=UPI0024056FD9|nr:glycosyltransferase family 2 protein [Haladaptatus sp. DYSN1]